MTLATQANVSEHLRRLIHAGTTADRTDRQLLERFVNRRDGDAFAALVRRYGPMVLGVCRRILGNFPDAEDAFQATFLVLVRRAASVGRPELLGNWLFGVAQRTALEARTRAARRQRIEQHAADRPPAESQPTCPETTAVLAEELGALPEKYRTPLILCYFEGRTHQEAAQALGVPSGSMSWRVGRGCEMLRERLVRRGVTLSAAALTACLAESFAPAAVPAALAGTTVAAAVGSLTGPFTGVSPEVAALAAAALPGTTKPARTAVVVLLAVCLAGVGVGFLLRPTPQPQAPPSEPRQAEAPRPAPAALDRHGDPMPAGAITRLGTTRFRSGHTVNSLTFASDGKTVVGLGWEDTFYVWDRATGREVSRLPLPEAWRSGAAVSRDGKLLAAGGRKDDRRVRIWEAATGKERLVSPPLEGAIDALRFSPDGATLAIACGKVVRLWDAATGKERRRIDSPADQGGPLVIAPDGKTLAVVGNDKIARLWPLEDDGPPRALEGHQDFIYSLAFSPDGRIVATGGADKDRTVRLWDTATGKETRRVAVGPGWVRPVSFAPDGKTLAVGGRDGRIRLLDAATGEERQQFRIPGQDDTWGPWVMALAFSPDGTTLASSGTEHLVRFWDLKSSKEVMALPGHSDAVRSVAFTPDGKRLLTAGDKTVRLWAVRTGEELQLYGDRSVEFSRALLAPDSKTVAATGGGVVMLWDAATGKELHRVTGHQNGASVALAPNGRRLATAGNRGDGTLRLWDVASGHELWKWTGGQLGFSSVAFSPDGTVIAAGSGYERVILFDAATGKEQRTLAWRHGFAGAVTFSPDGRLLAASGGKGNVIRLWNAATGNEVRLIEGHNGSVNALAFSADGKKIVSGSQDNTVRVWELASGKEVKRFAGNPGKGMLGGVYGVAFSPDGRSVASCSDDTTALIWDVTGLQEGGRLRAVRHGPERLRSLWDDLGGEDAAKAHAAAWALAASPTEAVSFLRERLQPIRPADAKTVARLVKSLDSEDFAEREKALKELETLGESATPELRKVLAGSPSAEVRRQLDRILAKYGPDGDATPERLRVVRAVEAVGHAGTPEARALLAEWAGGVADALLTREAKAAAGR
jgi:RNA polymerase sigma factor (sigma-70 family)